MVRKLTGVAAGILFLAGCDTPGEPQWQRMVGSPDEELTGLVEPGLDGDVVLVSDSQTSTDFFHPTEAGLMDPGVEGGTIHYVRYDGATGDLLAVRSLGEGAPIRDIATDGQGNTYVVGQLDFSNDFGDGPGPNRGVYILKLDQMGNVIWSRQFAEVLGGARENFRHIAYDASSDSVLVAGVYGGEGLDLGLGPLPDEIDGFFVVRFGADGTTLAVDTGFTEVGPMAVSASGEFAMTGFFGVDDQLVVGGQIFNTPDLTGNFFAVLDANIDLISVEMGAFANFQTEYDVAAADDGTYWAISETGDDVPGGPALNNGNYIAHYSAAGAYIAHRELSGARPQGIDIGAAGPVVVGNFNSGADFGLGPVAEDGGMFAVQYDESLDAQWVRLGTTSTEHSLNLDDVAILTTGNVAIAGQNSGAAQIDIGLGPVSGYGPALDTFIAVLSG